ncbi:alginate O-acetyltransferase AlgF [Entomomonas asaccharolytica]|uniref:Alginate biosynthesis protein AlgF n=1 Tax=Entomomonas asaccharolytica TaxID=2785331 RepID=A0A974ND60_9GAMM|nr:alginate O-acetyltransferase AlgF [Entomomonas asaccharolytica]QQP84354.1 alginate O-acetyltransferase AlgF [Entomomonas asaccharolytica]
MKLLKTFFVLASFLAFATHIQAQEGNADLYDAVAPADSSFVRIINLSSSTISATLTSKVNPQRVAVNQLSNYRFVAPGKHKVTAGSASIDLDLKANTAVTLVYENGKFSLINDQFSNEPRKAQVAFYNLTNEPMELKTADGKHEVIPAVNKNQTGSRKVNEIKIAFAAYSGSKKIASYPNNFLKKGGSYSYLVIPEGSGYKAIAQQSGIDPTE